MKILEVNNIDLAGRRFNGYDLIKDLSTDEISVKQAVIIKQSNDENVIKILKDDRVISLYEQMQSFEDNLSIHNVLSISSAALMSLKEYEEADIVHFHMFHNTKLSILSLLQIASEKKLVLSLHDPWFLTGRCVHFYQCQKWKNGCNKCQNLESLFPFIEDNCSALWALKKHVFDQIEIDIVVSSKWLYDLVSESPIFANQKRIHLIPFGINLLEFNQNQQDVSKRKLCIPKNDLVLFLRAQHEFKGTKQVIEALETLETNKSITVLTCDNVGLLKSIENKYKVIDLGHIQNEQMHLAFSACDIFLMPSKGESFGMMAIEAMASKKPVVVFNNTALPSVTFAPECGYLVNDGDSKGLMEAIKELLDNPDERTRRGELGRQICEKHYDINIYIAKMKKLYKEINNKKNINKQSIEATYPKSRKSIDKLYEYLDQGKGIKDTSSFKIDFSDIGNLQYIEDLNSKLYHRSLNEEIIRKPPLIFKIKQLIKRNKFIYAFIKRIKEKLK